MFSYFGSKSKIVKYYPSPKFGTIIEPFAGSARYSLYGDNWKKNVIIVDLNPRIIAIWRYLQGATPKDILSLPTVKPQQDIRDFKFPCAGARDLVFACCSRGSATFGNKTGKFCRWVQDRIRISKEIWKIKRWDIRLCSFDEIENIEATWFIDPPYQALGYRYPKHNINYSALLEWCKSRRGQVIICENEDSNWLPTPQHVKVMRGNKHLKQEIMQIFEPCPVV
jgi:site-specific DNA-adenine methylase